ncbi:MAG: hypothetical protein ACYC7E_12735 [Armatimonadota bacterium]
MAKQLIDGSLAVLRIGYAWKDWGEGMYPEGERLLTHAPTDQAFVEMERIRNPINASKGLFQQFAALGEQSVTEEAVRDFANQYGLLCGVMPHGCAGETLAEWEEEVTAMRRAMMIHQAMTRNDGAGLRDYLVWQQDKVYCFFGEPQNREAIRRTIKDAAWKGQEYFKVPMGEEEVVYAFIHHIFPTGRLDQSMSDSRYKAVMIASAKGFPSQRKRWELLQQLRVGKESQAKGERERDANMLAAKLYLRDAINAGLSPRVTTWERGGVLPPLTKIDIPVSVGVQYDEIDGDLFLNMQAETLRGILWLQFARMFTGEREYRQCPKCKDWFMVGEGRRSDAEYCSKRCQVNAANARSNKKRSSTRRESCSLKG